MDSLFEKKTEFKEKDFGLNLQKKVKMHPSIYEDSIDNHHLCTERIRCSKRLLNTSVGSVLTARNNSCSGIQSKSIEHGLGKQGVLNDDLQSTRVEIWHDEDPDEKLVPVGALFQAVIPEWSGKTSDSDSKWLGTRMWPCEHEHCNLAININPVGSGRADDSSCSCRIRDSVECVRFHIAEARMKLKLELGLAFYHLRHHEMGEEVCLEWSSEEEKRFKELVRENLKLERKWFWNDSLTWFARKSRKRLISYYFNVFVLRRRRYQNRVTPNSIDSDDDEAEFGCIGGDFGSNGECMEAVECSENKELSDIWD